VPHLHLHRVCTGREATDGDIVAVAAEDVRVLGRPLDRQALALLSVPHCCLIHASNLLPKPKVARNAVLILLLDLLAG
jgi:hypothetical protein